jgi:phosphoribosyl-ATP pyrophosphohydrolase
MDTASSPIGAVIDELYAVIESRRGADPETSYTAKLLAGHEDKLLKKIGEEATEVVMAAKDHDPAQVRYESADLVYHLLVVMAREGVTPAELAAELATRRR